MLLRRAPLALLLLTATAAAACGASPAATTSQDGPTPAGMTSAPATSDDGSSAPAGGTWPWDAQPTEDHSHVEVGGDLETGPPDGELLGEVDADPGLGLPRSTDGTFAWGVDPCTLVTAAEWSAWTERSLGSESVQPAIVLEDGEACGWIGPHDRVRMAIGAFFAGGPTGWLDESAAARGTAIDGLGDRAVWLTQWPVAASSTLVVRARGFDVVIEMSSLEPNDDLLLAGARELAAIAIGRLP
jgi:hypothetical protein